MIHNENLNRVKRCITSTGTAQHATPGSHLETGAQARQLATGGGKGSTVRTQIDGLLQRGQRVGYDLRALVLGLPHQLHGEDSGAGPLQEVLRVVLLPAATYSSTTGPKASLSLARP